MKKTLEKIKNAQIEVYLESASQRALRTSKGRNGWLRPSPYAQFCSCASHHRSTAAHDGIPRRRQRAESRSSEAREERGDFEFGERRLFAQLVADAFRLARAHWNRTTRESYGYEQCQPKSAGERERNQSNSEIRLDRSNYSSRSLAHLTNSLERRIDHGTASTSRFEIRQLRTSLGIHDESRLCGREAQRGSHLLLHDSKDADAQFDAGSITQNGATSGHPFRFRSRRTTPARSSPPSTSRWQSGSANSLWSAETSSLLKSTSTLNNLRTTKVLPLLFLALSPVYHLGPSRSLL